MRQPSVLLEAATYFFLFLKGYIADCGADFAFAIKKVFFSSISFLFSQFFPKCLLFFAVRKQEK